jgi:hypothetical protein
MLCAELSTAEREATMIQTGKVESKADKGMRNKGVSVSVNVPENKKDSASAAFKLLYSLMSRAGLEPATHWLKASSEHFE